MPFYRFDLYCMYFISILIAYSIDRHIAVGLGNKLSSTGLSMLLVLLTQNTCKTTTTLTACVIINKTKTDSMY